MQYLGIYASGQDHDRKVFNEVRDVLSMKGNGVLFKNEDECQQLFEEVTARLPYYHVEWLNDFDCDPLEESIVLAVSRGKQITYSIGYLHLYRCKRTFTPNVEV